MGVRPNSPRQMTKVSWSRPGSLRSQPWLPLGRAQRRPGAQKRAAILAGQSSLPLGQAQGRRGKCLLASPSSRPVVASAWVSVRSGELRRAHLALRPSESSALLNQFAELFFQAPENARFGHADGGGSDVGVGCDVDGGAALHDGHPERVPGALFEFATDEF